MPLRYEYAIDCLQQKLWEIENIWLRSTVEVRIHKLRGHAQEIRAAIDQLKRLRDESAS